MNTSVEVNPKKISYLLKLFRLDSDSFLKELNKKKEILTRSDFNKILTSKNGFFLDSKILKKIDEIFEVGISFYTDFLSEKILSKRELEEQLNDNVFFRKDSFNSNLNLESKKKVIHFNHLKREIKTLSENIDFNLNRVFDEKYTINDNSKEVATNFKKKFIEFERNLKKSGEIKNPVLIGDNIRIKNKYRKENHKKFLENLIRVIEEFNVFVFEFIDNKKIEEKQITFNGFYLNPNIIVIKRNQKYLKREIFTLMHEFAHYLLNIEEIDDKTDLNISESQENYLVEKWCNEFAFYFLDNNNFDEKIKNFYLASKENNYYKSDLDTLSENSFLSIYAYYINLKNKKKISNFDCKEILNYFEENRIKKIEIERNKKNEEDNKRIRLELEQLGIFPSEENIKKYKKENNKGFRGSKPIESSLFIKLTEINFSQGNFGETDLYGIIGSSRK